MKEETNMTAEQKKEYLSDPNQCPYCHSIDLEGSHFSADLQLAWQKVSCMNCGKKWEDQYRLSDVEPVN